MDWLKASSSGRPVGVDRDKKVILGYVVAQEGPFKTEGRGEFDLKSLKSIRALMNKSPGGLKSRFTHPDASNDGLGKFLGRVKKPSLETITVQREGESLAVHAIRGDLHLADSSFKTPSGDLGTYVMDLAEEDSDMLSSSLVLTTDMEEQLDEKGKPLLDDNGEELPPLWRPIQLHASDIVDEGEAVDGLLATQLSADGLPDEVVRKAAQLLKQQFGGRNREFVSARLNSWVERALDHYWPVERDEVADAQLMVETLEQISSA